MLNRTTASYLVAARQRKIDLQRSPEIAEALAYARARKEEMRKRARRNAGAFIEYALRNEADGSRLVNADFHWEWHEHLDHHPMAVLVAPVEHAKTQQISVGRVLWRLGTSPNRTIALIQGTERMALKTLSQIRGQIERNPRVREVFPRLRRSRNKGDPWTQHQITVDRDTIAKDPSIQARGVGGDIVGSRLTDIILDDVLTFENTRTDEQRKKLIEWFDTTVFTRLLPGGVIWAIGTPWHPEDLLHELSKRPGFATRRYSAVHNPDDPPARWTTLWPEQWDLDRLTSRRDNMPESTFVRKYLCRVRLDSSSRFRKVWLDRMCQLGIGRTFLAEAPRIHKHGSPLQCFTGVDLAIGDKEENALTCIFTIALMPDGRRLVVDIESGRWQAPEILDRLYSVYRRYDSEIHVESNAAQKFLVQIARGQIPVTAHHTGANKWDAQYGVESLAVEMRNGEWIMPSGVAGESVPEEGKSFISECLHYDPEEHTGDRLMAAWIAREALRKYSAPRVQSVDHLQR